MDGMPVWAEIDLKALSNNVREIRRITIPEAEVMAVVKANAYGHGAVEVSKTALANGASRLAVARSAEGRELRMAGIQAPILVLGYTPLGLISEIAEYELEQTVYGKEYALAVNEQAGKIGAKIPVHVKVDTGMGRIGVVAGTGLSINEIEKIASQPYLDPVGIFTHFAAADSADKSYTKSQLEKFLIILENLRKNGLEFPIRHCANSAAIIELPESNLDLVRAGIIMYGLYPSEEVSRRRITVKPAMSFKTTVSQVKKVPQGFSVSYGCTYVTDSPAVIATLPVGYADGYSRLLSSRGEVLVGGKRAPVIGRVCMDQCMINVVNIPGVVSGDEVVLFGMQGNEFISVEEIGEWIGTINYEVICMVGIRVPRIYIN